jgi:hypothetical protein
LRGSRFTVALEDGGSENDSTEAFARGRLS